MSSASRTHLCRFCATPLTDTLVDLGATPLANAYVAPEAADRPDPVYPLCARVCASCFLVQVDDAVPAEEIFSDYAYFSSTSTSWVDHARRYMAAMQARFDLGPKSKIVEIASNDGYLLQHAVAAGIPVLGVEPAANVAEAAIARGVATDVAFFGQATAERLRAKGHAADLIVSNNVLAHVPHINDFTSGIPVLLKPDGVWTIEFPHLLTLIAGIQFDTIYHEHYSYISFLFLERLLDRHGLRAFDVEEIPTHGGSLRVFACHANAGHAPSAALARLRAKEADFGLPVLSTYADFQAKVASIKAATLAFLDRCRADGLKVAAYGAAAKGNTFLNHCGIGPDRISFVVDRSPAKQGRLLPGSRIPIRAPSAIDEERPDILFILPWNLRDEIMAQMQHIGAWGGRFAVAIPRLHLS